MSKIIKILFLVIFLFFIASVVWVGNKTDIICVPEHVNLDESKYLLLKVDTLESGKLKIKKILFYNK